MFSTSTSALSMPLEGPRILLMSWTRASKALAGLEEVDALGLEIVVWVTAGECVVVRPIMVVVVMVVVVVKLGCGVGPGLRGCAQRFVLTKLYDNAEL